MQWKTLRLPHEMQGHKFFSAPDGRVAIADWSGDYPHQTDDGVLWLDNSRPMKISDDLTYVYIPLLKADGEQTTTVSDIRTAAFAKGVGNMRLDTDNKNLRIILRMVEENVLVNVE